MTAHRVLLVTALLAVTATPVLAQFTSTVAAPRRERPEQVAARRDSVRVADSVSVSERMTEMREWVDSAAVAIAADAPPPAADTTAPEPIVSGGAIEATQSPAAEPPTTAFREGAPAPATATPLPVLALLGLAAVGAGTALLVRRRS